MKEVSQSTWSCSEETKLHPITHVMAFVSVLHRKLAVCFSFPFALKLLINKINHITDLLQLFSIVN